MRSAARSAARILLALAALMASACGDRSDSSAGAADAPHQASDPQREIEPPPWFVEQASARGLRFMHDSGHRDRYYIVEDTCGGVALLDIDNDGDLDAYLVQSGGVEDSPQQRPPNRMFRNDGRGFFEDITDESGTGDRGYGMGVATGDYDNDGDTDLYVSNYGPNVLYRNEGDGRFTDVTSEAGVGHEGFSSSAAFVDYDMDGDLDLFVLNYLHWSPATELECRNDLGELDYCAPVAYQAPTVDVLYRNEDDGTFTDVTVEAGIDRTVGTGLGVVCGDFSGDGLVDLYVANDGMRNLLWVNQGDGTFIEQAMIMGCALDQDGVAKAGMGVTAADVDLDGDEDLLVVNLSLESDSFYRNAGGYFVDDTAAAGLAGASRSFTRFGLALADFDNDGFLDVYEACGRISREALTWSEDPYAEPDIVLRGTAEGRFELVAGKHPTGEPLAAASRGAAFGDIDNDGDLDVLIANRDGSPHLLMNTEGQKRSWSMIRVIDEHGRDALGAQVVLTAGGRRLMRVARSAYSYCAANDPRVHFGLGDAEEIESVEIIWPDGKMERFEPPSVRTISTLRQGEGRR